ncbi:MAG: hypothetical protein JWN76_2638 [Chitinophagaceae bacterium]|nr:hypothetical protein [Chitinophagaceae bacterium]
MSEDDDKLKKIINSIEPVAQKAFLSYCIANAIMDEYCAAISKLTGEEEDIIKARIVERSGEHLVNLKEELGLGK